MSPRLRAFRSRQPVFENLESRIALDANSVFLVTGAAGSIGSEICRQLLQLSPTRPPLRLFRRHHGAGDLRVGKRRVFEFAGTPSGRCAG